MPRLKELPARLSKINSAAVNCTKLLGIKPAALGVVYHCTKRCRDRYYRVFDDALWAKVMRHIPFGADAIAGGMVAGAERPHAGGHPRVRRQHQTPCRRP